MHSYFVILLCFCVYFGHCQVVPEDAPEDPPNHLAEGEKKMSESILAILEDFKQPDPVGLPEPYPVPDMKQTLSFATVYFKNSAVYGISKFRIQHVNAEMGAMEVHAAMSTDTLQARGNYTMSTWLNRAQGPFTVDITGLIVQARAGLGVERDGKLRAQGITIDLSFERIAVNFENLGMFGSLLQGIINSVGTAIVDSIKPLILKESYAKMRREINSKLEEFAGDMQFPNSISPLDMVVADVRRKVQGIFSVALENTWITGASSFQRVGNISLKMENNATADLEIGTQKLEGRTQWYISAIDGLANRAGIASFSVEYITGRFILGQPLDTIAKLIPTIYKVKG